MGYYKEAEAIIRERSDLRERWLMDCLRYKGELQEALSQKSEGIESYREVVDVGQDSEDDVVKSFV
jgi:hypothetical protein